MNTQQFGSALKDLGFDFYSGVPCSFLKYLINYAINECDYVMAANEGDAVATSAGAYLAGKKSVVLMQNSGLTNATSPLTSLNYSFKLPVLGFVSLRGEEGLNDEPQHELMGRITGNMLSSMEVEWEYLANDLNEAKEQLKRANQAIENNKTFFFVVKKGTFDEVTLKTQNISTTFAKELKHSDKEEVSPTRTEALTAISNWADNKTALLATTGKTGRELFEIEDKPNNLYMVGSMGCISSMALGLALADKSIKSVAIDGDGAALMRMGNFGTNGYYHPNNLLHILLDNSTHDSTGGQATISPNIDFATVAHATGYPVAIKVNTLDELKDELANWSSNPKATFIHLKIAKGSPKELGRPTIKPHEVKERLMNFLKN
ncbi:phosphonopyruvate decarboxylase [Fulvivirga lutea]|uniref:Phosphonopyruvate decarboxylase n=1 Tax=Fulvivirga lutea TaxID=2810512 RepID=A0A974ZZG7_9BACT|nr:phosphonopyruvate decarboxylase [Fulvivirga lutea]QSE96096.1 phosphonopyruvate decarboxylase [Fulvivirga lutea]